jgi:FAD/FMN-containing dehydrogenase
VFYPDSSVYEERLESIWSLSAQQPPWCVVLPESTEDASTIMKIISKKRCPFGIRAGGHGFFALANSIKKGITIDFGKREQFGYHESVVLMLIASQGL